MSVTNILKEIGFRVSQDKTLYQFGSGFEFYITVTDDSVWLNPRTYDANKPALAKFVKGLAAKYPQYFELVKKVGTIVPTLRMKHEMLKTIEKIKK